MNLVSIRRRRRRALTVFVAPLVAIAGATALHCGSSDAPPGATLPDADAGDGASSIHHNPDTSIEPPPGDDAGSDVDADANDATACASLPDIGDAWGPGWRPLLGAPSACVLAVPVNVASSVDPVGFIPCDNGMTGCQEATSIDGCGSSFGAFNRASHGPSGEAKWLRFERKRGPTVFEDVVIDVATSATLAAWRYDMHSHCSILAALGPNVIATIGSWQDGGAYAYGTPADLMLATPPAFLPLPASLPLSLASDTEMSDTTLAIAFGFTVRAPVGSVTFSAPPPTTTSPRGVDPVVVGNDVFVSVDNVSPGEWLEEYRLDTDGTHVPLRSKPSTHVSAFATDGTTMFWTESFGDADGGFIQPTVEVWAAPYTSDPTTLDATAHRLATVPAGGTHHVAVASFAFGGIYGFQLESSAVFLVRGSDGAMKTLSPGPGRQFEYPLLATPTELWSIESPAAGGPGQRLTRITYGAW